MIRTARVPALVGGLCLLVFSSCSPKRTELSLDPAAIDAPGLISLVRDRSTMVHSLEGRGTVTFESTEFGGTAAFELTMRKPDSLLVLLEGPFGIDLGTLFLSRERYVAYNSQDNLVVTGIPHGKTIRTVIPFDLSFDEVLNAFSGTFEIPDYPADVKTYAVDDGMFLLVLSCGARVCSYWIDHTLLQVSRYEVHDNHGTILMQATMASFSGEGDANVPRRIMLWFPSENKQIAVQYSSLTVNPADISFAYSVPSDARVLNR